jgi:hypothetical protein
MASIRTAVGIAVVVIVAVACGSTPVATAPGGSSSGGPASSGQTTAQSATHGADSASPAAASASAAASPVAGGAACSGTDVASALKAAAKAQTSARSYRVSGTTTVSGRHTEYTLEIVNPDRIHVHSAAFEFIAIGSTTWRKASGGWQKASGVDVSSLVGGLGQLNADLISSATFSATNVDPLASVDGQPATLYRYHERIPDELEADSQFWLDPGTCRPIKNVASSTASNGKSEIAATYSGWDQVFIEPPA